MAITVVGLGPSDLSFVGQAQRDTMLDPGATVIVRTLLHPAAAELAGARAVESCDDLYETLESFDDVYDAIVSRVIDAASQSDVVYAVPGSASVGERAVSALRTLARERQIDVTVMSGISFLDLAYIACEIDPIADGLQVVGGGLMRGMGRPRAGAIANFVGYYVFGLPLAGLLAFHFELGTAGILYGFVGGLGLIALLLCLWTIRTSHRPIEELRVVLH